MTGREEKLLAWVRMADFHRDHREPSFGRFDEHRVMASDGHRIHVATVSTDTLEASPLSTNWVAANAIAGEAAAVAMFDASHLLAAAKAVQAADHIEPLRWRLVLEWPDEVQVRVSGAYVASALVGLARGTAGLEIERLEKGTSLHPIRLQLGGGQLAVIMPIRSSVPEGLVDEREVLVVGRAVEAPKATPTAAGVTA